MNIALFFPQLFSEREIDVNELLILSASRILISLFLQNCEI